MIAGSQSPVPQQVRICPNAATQKQRKESAYPWKASSRQKKKKQNRTVFITEKRKYIYIKIGNCLAKERENKKKMMPSVESFLSFATKSPNEN